MSKRFATLAIVMGLLVSTVPASALQRVRIHVKRVVPIAIVINGNTLSVDPPPKVYQGHLLVPVRRIIEALGLDFEEQGKRIITHAGSKTIALTLGSKYAEIDDDTIELEAAPVEIKDVLYAPLRFFADALDAQAIFDRRANSVSITSSLVGRSESGTLSHGAEREYIGTVTAVDLNSDPPTITLTYNASVKTVPVTADSEVSVQDVNTGTSNPGDLNDVHPGDFAQIFVDKNGHAARVVDAYGSRVGVVAASAGGELVLSDGHVIAPGRETAISLNGKTATVNDVQIGDEVMVRYNIDSSDVRQIIATRQTATEAQPASNGVSISAVDVSPVRPLKADDVATVTMRGTPGGLASFDIGPYIEGLSLAERTSGTYEGSYRVARGVNFANAPIIAHLNVRGTDAPSMQSQTTLTVSTEPPGIGDFAPDPGVVVNNNRPSIYATFVANTVSINPSSASLSVNGHDVTSQCVRSQRFIQYTPGIDYRQGPVDVVVRVADYAGNVSTKRWTFYIKVRT
ncbi:MAG: copper amine oxidase N-terminal domain-containing protein [Candidatus Eremiobacteraeota bacterium]|nr:copper amine oxidase N-terminal domain-containing protein [Candidatus Eremiobacteraeota bacterium]